MEELTFEPGITLITGLRGCGKSSLAADFADLLREHGTSPDAIVTINFDELHQGETLDLDAVHGYLNDCLKRSEDVFLFLDEPKSGRDFEAIVGSLYLNRKLHICVITSWRGIIDRELATVLSGGYRELRLWPLGFPEVVGVWRAETAFSEQKKNAARSWEQLYLSVGGLPRSALTADDMTHNREYLDGVLGRIIVRDVLRHYNLRDVNFLLEMLGYIYRCGYIGLTGDVIADCLTMEGKRPHLATITGYFKALREAGLLISLPRYDLKKKRVLKSALHWYAPDPGLRRLMLGEPDVSAVGLWENLVCLELWQRDYSLYKARLYSVDLGLMATGERTFYVKLTSLDIMDTAVKNLKTIPDQYPKYVLTVEETAEEDRQGITVMSVRKFLWGNYSGESEA